MRVSSNSILRLSGSDEDPWLTAKVKFGEGGLRLQRGKLTGNGEVFGNVIADEGSLITPAVCWKEELYANESGLAGSLHFFGNLSLYWAELLFFVNGFDKSNFSQVIVHQDLYMKPPLFPNPTDNYIDKANMIGIHAGSHWTSLLQNSNVRTPSLVLYQSISGTPCSGTPIQPTLGPDSCQESTSRHDLSFLFSASGAIPECPAYGCPGVPECSGQGRCEDGYCVCNKGWANLDCSAEDCPGTPDCSGHGFCLVDDKDNTPRCQCLEGWKGEACQTAECPNDCTDEEHGYCDASTLTPSCVCHVGYLMGPQLDCSLPFLRCPGFGTCNNQTGNCSCLPGRTGADCSIPVCEGRPNQCSHHGPCLWDEQSNKAFCDCDEGWGGEDCSLPQCPSASCSGHGVCVTELDPPRCLCDAPKDILVGETASVSDAEGWTGERCEVLVMACTSEESQCGARCGENEDEGYGCMTNECPEGWRGWDCTTPVCINTGNPECHGHGRCVAQDTNSPPQCECREGWLPPDCRLAMCSVEAGQTECSGRGKCNLHLSPPRCECAPFAYGPLCEHYDPPCAGEIECSGHGQCINGTCQCDEDWRGLDCSIIDHQGECANNCSSNGVCKPSSSSEGKNLLPVCHCFEGWFGTDCSRSSEHEEKEEDFMEENPWAVPVIVISIVAIAAMVSASLVYRRKVAFKRASQQSRREMSNTVNF
ncbi:FAD-dependent urate hydroxylase [Balamuthia mandrillaris]